jgi:predicted nuclease of predicted toxin-antitoxin system
MKLLIDMNLSPRWVELSSNAGFTNRRRNRGHTAVAKGTDVDQPPNLAKSVTVE